MLATRPAVSFCFKDILLATDFSAGSEVALAFAQGIARQQLAKVHAIHVEGPNSYQLLDPDALAITFCGIEDGLKNPVQVLRNLFQGLPHQVPVHGGAIWDVVNDVVRRNEIDLLVLATHGRTGLPRLLHGSVAEELFRNVSCPVLTIGPDVRRPATGSLDIKSVLLATDFDPRSSAPLYAGWLANEFNAKLTALHVVHDNPSANVRTIREGITEIQSMITDDMDLWCEPDFIVEHGKPAATILEVAKAVQPDIIVLGARYPEPAKIVTHLPWDTAARVIAGAECPVLTVRDRELLAPASFEFESAMRGL